MRKVREVLRLRHALSLSYREIGEALGVSKTAAGEIVRRAEVMPGAWVHECQCLVERYSMPPADRGQAGEGVRDRSLGAPPAWRRAPRFDSSSVTRSNAEFQRASNSRATWRFCGSTSSYRRPASDAS